MEQVYVRDFKLRVRWVSISYWSFDTAPYPYKGITTTGNMLKKVAEYWTYNLQNAVRDEVHMLSGRGLTYGSGDASWGDSFPKSVCTVDEFGKPNSYSITTIRDTITRAIIPDNDIYRNICHEIGHTLGANDVPCQANGNIMCPKIGKSDIFDNISISEISNYLASSSCLQTTNSPNFTNSLYWSIDNQVPYSTPIFIDNNAHILRVVEGSNANPLLINSTFTATDPNIYFYYTTPTEARFEARTAASFSINIYSTNTCFYSYWGIPFVIRNRVRMAIYPNPSDSGLQIDSPTTESNNFIVKVFDEKGNFIEEATIFNKENLKTSHLKNGVYYLHIYDIYNSKEVKRIYINH